MKPTEPNSQTKAPDLDTPEDSLSGGSASSNTPENLTENTTENSTETTQKGQAIDKKPMENNPVFAAKARGLRLKIMRFTPSWFSVTMGTSVCNLLLLEVPFAVVHPVLRGIGAAFLIFSIIQWITFFIISVARYTLYPKIFILMLQHDVHSLFLGTIPMGLVTIVTGIARTGEEYGYGRWSLDLAIVLWWVALVISMLTCYVVPMVMFTRHNHTTQGLTAAWILPIVPPITVAASGATIATLLIDRGRLHYASTILISSYVVGGNGFLIACGIMVIYFYRLALHHLPPREVIVSTFLPLGPCGLGGFFHVELGHVAMILLPRLAESQPDRAAWAVLAMLNTSLYGAGIVVGLLFWGLGMWWFFIATVSVGSHYISREISFNMGWWAFTFPLGSLNLLTYSLGKTFDSLFFKVIGTMMTGMVVGLWLLVFIPTSIGFLRGTLFVAPCLASLPKEYIEKFTPVKEEDTSELR